MFEKIKDFIYDISDSFFAIVIVIVMVFSISYIMTDAFTIDILPNFGQKVPDNSLVAGEDVNESPEVIVDQPTSPTEPEEPEEPEEPDTEPETPTSPSETITVEIKPGSYAVEIANQLKELGLIEDTSVFLKRTEELELAGKLQSGTFKIKSDSTLDTMIYILAGRN